MKLAAFRNTSLALSISLVSVLSCGKSAGLFIHDAGSVPPSGNGGAGGTLTGGSGGGGASIGSTGGLPGTGGIGAAGTDGRIGGAGGGSGGLADAGQSANSGQGGSPHLELCGIFVTCKDGVLSGMYGTYCSPIAGVCPLGCRLPSDGTTDLRLDPFAFAQTLCVSPAGDDGSADGVDAAAPDGI